MKKFLFMSKMLCLALLIMSCQRTSEHPREILDRDKLVVKDPHSFADIREAKMSHLNWDAEVDFDKHVINGVATIQFIAAHSAKELVLDTKELTIHEIVWPDGTEAEYKLGYKIKFLGQPLHIQLKEGMDSVIIRYTTSEMAEALRWLSPQQTAGKKHPFLFTQSQAILARSWIPLQDSPGIRFTYNATVKVPADLIALMSAENPQEKNGSGVYEFKMEQPIPAYLMALSVGDLEFSALGDRSGVYAEPIVIEKAAYEFGDLENMISTAEDLYGPYRWERYDIIVLPPSFPFGGMENPRLTFATPTILAGDRSLTSLIAHELAHSWSGNLVTNATWDDFWLNEGFTVYFEQRIMEALYGRDYAEMLASLSYQGLQDEIQELIAEGKAADTELKLALEGRNPDEGMTSIAYDKGYLFLRSIEEEVGREKFDAFLNKYFSENAFEAMTTEDFLDYIQTHLYAANALDYPEERLTTWIYESDLPEDAPKPTSDKFAKVEAQLEKWIEGTPAKQLNTEEWSSHEWLHFVRSLPDTLEQQKVKELDEAFGFTLTGNTEVLTAWLVKAIQYQYDDANKKLEDFLTETGRRKFLMPLYKELIKTNDGEIMARKIYDKARPNYHYVSTSSIDELLNWIKE